MQQINTKGVKDWKRLAENEGLLGIVQEIEIW